MENADIGHADGRRYEGFTRGVRPVSALPTETVVPEETVSIAGESTTDTEAATAGPSNRRFRFGGIVAFGVLPALILPLSVVGGYFKYQSNTITDSQAAALSSVRAATEGSIAMLSYTPDTAEATL